MPNARFEEDSSAISVANVDNIAPRKTAKKSLKTMGEKIDLRNIFHIRRESMSSLYTQRGSNKSHGALLFSTARSVTRVGRAFTVQDSMKPEHIQFHTNQLD